MDRRYNEFLENLDASRRCTQKALKALTRPNGPNRSLWYRIRLGRAQRILIKLHNQELERKEKE